MPSNVRILSDMTMATMDPLETDFLWQGFNPGIPHNPAFPEKLYKEGVILDYAISISF